MEEKNYQISLYQQREKIKKNIHQLKLENFHFQYLLRFIKKHKKEVKIMILLIFFLVILEVILSLFSHSFISQFSALLIRKKMPIVFFILSAGVMIYLVCSFIGLKIEKTLIVYLLNDLRRGWFKIFLHRPFFKTKSQNKASLIAKISYHLPLLQMGVEKSLIGSMRWILYILGLISITFFYNTKLLIIVLAFIPINIAIGVIGYFIAKNYITKETTLYSEIIKNIVTDLYELPFIQSHRLEEKSLKKLDDLVKIDTYFRIRRNLWLNFGPRVIFALLILLAGIFYILQIYFPSFFLQIEIGNLFLSGIIIFYLTRLLYTSLQIGFYSLPTKLGLILSVPKSKTNKRRFINFKNFQTISFNAKKTKLIKSDGYSHHLKFEFKKSEKILIFGKNPNKNQLGLIFSGQGQFNISSWIVKINGKRFFYKHWQQASFPAYFIKNDLSTEKKIGEILTGKNKEDITPLDVEKTFQTLSPFKEFNFIMSLSKFMGHDFQSMKMNLTELFSLQAAYCLIKKPLLIIVDAIYADLNNEITNKVFKILTNQLKESIFIVLSGQDNSLLKYDKKYFLFQKGVEKI
ncbi:MAG: hypothetical protein PHW15_02325 [Patescibacteria group bacterium]|jgi:ABC-type multidrug transport system fused ATPase/permease subunit|nr:hypothetical protein [Patescibacteria group bacterium]MDD5172824.1 hypothetical protein [Patescibacteria group bacterium]